MKLASKVFMEAINKENQLIFKSEIIISNSYKKKCIIKPLIEIIK